jgi:glycine betaine/choline ABC-type transport system substrate-binding protein
LTDGPTIGIVRSVMSPRPRRFTAPAIYLPAVLAILAASLTLLSCGGAGGRSDGIVIGSKNFTEQVILGEILAALIETRAGIPVTRKLDLGGTFICHQALVAGELDLYVEYTGTALTAILGESPNVTPEEAYRIVKEAYAEQFDLLWTEPLGFNDTFAFIVSRESARRHGLRTISDLVRVQETFRPGFGFEFLEREDGYKGLITKYGLQFAHRPLEMRLGLHYRALVEGQVDLVVANSTDGVIASLGLVILEDDKAYFPPYDAVPVVRQETLERHPQIRPLLSLLGDAIPETLMQEMNYAVDGELQDPREVARRFVAFASSLLKAISHQD